MYVFNRPNSKTSMDRIKSVKPTGEYKPLTKGNSLDELPSPDVLNLLGALEECLVPNPENTACHWCDGENTQLNALLRLLEKGLYANTRLMKYNASRSALDQILDACKAFLSTKRQLKCQTHKSKLPYPFV